MLTKEQIDQLFKFCEKHFVYSYEVQSELVDHLANAIETEMEVNKHLTFEKALDKVYSDFGVMGFSTIVRERGIQLSKKIRKEYFHLVLQQFRWPAVLRFVVTVSFVYTLCRWSELAAIIASLTIILSGTVFEFYAYKKVSKEIKKSGKKFMHAGYIYPSGIVFLYIYFYFSIFADKIFDLQSANVNPALPAIFTGISVVCITVSIHLTKKLRNKMMEDYPEVFHIAN